MLPRRLAAALQFRLRAASRDGNGKAGERRSDGAGEQRHNGDEGKTREMIREIVEFNSLTSTTIHSGQELAIPVD